MPHPHLRALITLAQAPAQHSAIAPRAHRLVRAFRLAGLASAHDGNPQPRLVELLGSDHAARSFRLLLSGMAHVWPDPLTAFRPCCPQLTPDETCLLAMIHHASRNDRRAFDAAIGEMIGEHARDWLFIKSTRLAAVL